MDIEITSVSKKVEKLSEATAAIYVEAVSFAAEALLSRKYGTQSIQKVLEMLA
ncbi:MAG: hypothetical protein O7E52_02315 [Candidatus Poribacteria bacterium]|nr:hypothetical protein [Candidatus Poribacteria bacterium]